MDTTLTNNTSQANNGRIEYFDILRGLMMLLVIYCHVIGFSIQTTSKINDIFVSFRMPLFFFISGFFVYSHNYSISLFKKRSNNRLIKQLYPTLLIGLLYCYLFVEGDFIKMLYSKWKYGYWFTITAVEMFFLIMPPILLFSNFIKLKLKYKIGGIVLYTILLEFVFRFCLHYFSSETNRLMGTEWLYMYFPFFTGGIVFRAYYNRIIKFATTPYITILGVITFFSFYYIYNNFYTSFIIGFAAIIVLHNIIYYICHSPKNINPKVSNYIKLIGKNTLEIYLFHYFFIQLLANGFNYLPFKLDALIINRWSEFPIILIISICVAVLCIILTNVLKNLKIYKYIFPYLNNNKNIVVSAQ